MDSLKNHLNSYNLKEIKNIIKSYNLHTVIKLSQTKDKLIEQFTNKIYEFKNGAITTKRTIINTPNKYKEDLILKKRILQNKKDDEKFEKENKLIQKLIKEQNAIKIKKPAIKQEAKKPIIKQEAKKPAIEKDKPISIDAKKEYKKLKDNGFQFYISQEQFGQIYNKKNNQKLLFINNLFRENNSKKNKKIQASQFKKIIDEMDGLGGAGRFRVDAELMDEIDKDYNNYNYLWFEDFSEGYSEFINDLENSRDFERESKKVRKEILEEFEEHQDAFNRDIRFYSTEFFTSDGSDDEDDEDF